MQATGVFRHSRWDAALVAASVGHALVLLLGPPALVVGLGMWWCANTVSHNFIHLPFFRSRPANDCFSVHLSLLLGVPQTLWRQRHMAHHADAVWRFRPTRLLLAEAGAIAAWWCGLALFRPEFFLFQYLPGLALGLFLCHLQGHFEHARGTTSHYGWLYNFAFFNDGYHVEHHARPSRHWRELPQAGRGRKASRWPAVLRWLERVNLETLERCVLRSRRLQRMVVRLHRPAFQRLLGQFPRPRKVAVVGGALFPRTALLLKEIEPAARLVIVDSSEKHIEVAHTFLNGSVDYEHRTFESTAPAGEYDLVVIPLSYVGDRERLYSQPTAPAVLVQDWIWRRRGNHSTVISWLLLKRLNLVLR